METTLLFDTGLDTTFLHNRISCKQLNLTRYKILWTSEFRNKNRNEPIKAKANTTKKFLQPILRAKIAKLSYEQLRQKAFGTYRV